jgi:O-antigen ligase
MKRDWLINTTIFIAPVFCLILMKGGAVTLLFYIFYVYLAAICVCAVQRIPKHFYKNPTIVWMLVWILVSFISIFWSTDLTRWLTAMVQHIALGALIILAFDKRIVKPSFIAFIPIILFTNAFGAIGVISPDLVLDFYESTNILGSSMFICVLYLVWGWKVIDNIFFRILALIAIVNGLWIIILSETRSVLLGLFFALTAYFLLKIKSRVMPILIIYGVFIASYFFVQYYISSSQADEFGEVEVGTKNVYSGRHLIWAFFLDAIYDSPFIGHGAGATATLTNEAVKVLPEEYIGLSAHNHHLQLLYQVGLIGFIPFFLFIKNLFYELIKTKNSLLGASFLIGVLLQQNFEVFLSQNNFILGVLLWVSILASFKQASSP